MGTQQILLIVLSVIIVGIAVAVGITMFNAQATNSNRQAIMGDMNNLASSALAYFKTPTTHGGGGNQWVSIDAVGQWLGYGFDAGVDSLGTGNGSYVITLSGTVLTITGVGTEPGNDSSVAGGNVSGDIDIDGSDSSITAAIIN